LFRLSLNSIMHRRLRAWLTLIGIIIGVAAVVSLISIGEGAQASVQQRLSGFGADIITISPGGESTGAAFGNFRIMGQGGGTGEIRSISSTNRSTSTTETPTLTKKDAVIIGGNPNISAVTPVVSERGDMIFESKKSGISIRGIDPNFWGQFNNTELASGRFLNSSDSTGILIGDSIANGTFDRPITIGRQVTIQDAQAGQISTFNVVGILQKSGTGFGGNGGDNVVYMTNDNAWHLTDVNKGDYSSIQAKVKSTDSIEDTIAELTSALQISRRVNEKTQDFSITSSESIRQQIEQITQTLTLFLGAIAGISLIVGAVGIANSMFTSVLEKTKEIGILKALGASEKEIMVMFVIESGLFGLVGGIIGAIIGAAVSLAISGIGLGFGPGGATTVVSLQLFVFAVVLSTIIGVVSGIMPARSAAKLKPVEALRYE